MAEVVKVINTSEDAVQDGKKNYVTAIKVTYLVGDQGPFYLKIPKSEYTSDLAIQQMQAFANELARLPK